MAQRSSLSGRSPFGCKFIHCCPIRWISASDRAHWRSRCCITPGQSRAVFNYLGPSWQYSSMLSVSKDCRYWQQASLPLHTMQSRLAPKLSLNTDLEKQTFWQIVQQVRKVLLLNKAVVLGEHQGGRAVLTLRKVPSSACSLLRYLRNVLHLRKSNLNQIKNPPTRAKLRVPTSPKRLDVLFKRFTRQHNTNPLTCQVRTLPALFYQNRPNQR